MEICAWHMQGNKAFFFWKKKTCVANTNYVTVFYWLRADFILGSEWVCFFKKVIKKGLEPLFLSLMVCYLKLQWKEYMKHKVARRWKFFLTKFF